MDANSRARPRKEGRWIAGTGLVPLPSAVLMLTQLTKAAAKLAETPAGRRRPVREWIVNFCPAIFVVNAFEAPARARKAREKLPAISEGYRVNPPALYWTHDLRAVRLR